MSRKGLKYLLNKKIEQAGYLSIDEVNEIANKTGYKISNAERRLRKSESPSVDAVFNEKNKYIIGYKWVGSGIFPLLTSSPTQIPNHLFKPRIITNVQ